MQVEKTSQFEIDSIVLPIQDVKHQEVRKPDPNNYGWLTEEGDKHLAAYLEAYEKYEKSIQKK